jgi:tetratricopeptide (TPR) repeat protein
LDEGFATIAAVCYKRAIMCDEDYGDAWYDLGIASTSLNMYDEAKMCYRRAVDINQADTDALNNLGLLFYREENHQLALSLFEAAVAQKPTAPDLFANKCLCLASLERREEAYHEYVRGLSMVSAPSTTILNNFVILLYGMGRYEEMLKNAYKLLQLKPTSYRAWSHIGTALKSQGNLEAAMHAYRASVRLEPHYFEGWSYLASIFSRRGHFAETIAITTATQSLYQLPTQMLPGLFYHLTAFANDVVDNRKYE